MAYLHRLRARVVPVAQPPKATEEEGAKAFPHAVEMILYIACLHSALYDLQDEMEAIGQYRHGKKKWLNEAIAKWAQYIKHCTRASEDVTSTSRYGIMRNTTRQSRLSASV